MKKAALLILILAAAIAVFLFLRQDDPRLETLAQGLDTPWAIDFLPDGTLIFTERPGRVNILTDNGVKQIASILVSETAESGLMGIAAHPNFAQNNWIYLYYTAVSGNRVSRWTYKNGILADELILLDNIPNAMYHDGGRIKFGPDGYLYVTTGDATEPSSAQIIQSTAGKILRMTDEGGVPADNPFGNHVYSFGHRNPQGLAWKDSTLYASEHGPTRNDEVNLIAAGANYGWPSECVDTGDFVQPIRCFTEFTIAPAGIAIHENNLYIAGLRGAQIRKINLETGAEEEFITGLGRIRDVVIRDGHLYIATSNRDGRGLPGINDDRILRIRLN